MPACKEKEKRAEDGEERRVTDQEEKDAGGNVRLEKDSALETQKLNRRKGGDVRKPGRAIKKGGSRGDIISGASSWEFKASDDKEEQSDRIEGGKKR